MPAIMLTQEQLTTADKSIIKMLRGGRVTAPYVAEEQDLALEYARSRLVRLMEHGHVKRVHNGLYELVEEPTEEV